MIFGLSLLSLALPLVASAAHFPRSHFDKHNDLAKRAPGDIHIYKRFSSSKWSFYDVGLGACGQYNVESDFIVALNSAQYGGGYPGPNCFKSITMTYNGKTATATIMDQCPGCPYGGLDLSRGLFRFFAAESVGIIYGEWYFNDGNGDSPPAAHTPPAVTTTKKTTSTTPQWTPTPTWTPEPTTTWVPEPTTSSTKKKTKTSTWIEPTPTPSIVEVPPTTSEHTTSTSISTTSSTSISASNSTAALSTSAVPSSSSVASSIAHSASSVNFASGAASGLAAPTGTIVSSESDPNNINSINKLFINLGGLITGAAKSD